jgi:hypothetical protein
MKHESLRKSVAALISLPLLVALLATATVAQEPPKQPDDPATAAQVERKKPRGRLPTYFAKVVNTSQREEIYEIQSRYVEQIEKLQQQLKELVAKRDAEVDGVLSTEQMAEVMKLRREREARRKSSDGSSPGRKP